MEDGCKLTNYDNKCMKYNCYCEGSVNEKKECPVWGKVLAYEEYLEHQPYHEKIL